MHLYLFTHIDQPYKTDFDDQMHRQNVKISHLHALIVFIVTAIINLTSLFIDYAHIIKNNYRYQNATNYFILTSFFVLVLLTWIRLKTPLEKQGPYNFIALLYSILFIGGCLWMTFLAQENPKNTLAMILLGSLVVATIMTFSFYETLLITFSCFVVFTVGLRHFQTNYEQWLMNYFGLCFIMTGFFFLSRLSYSYHANYFIKVKIIEEKNTQIKIANQAKNEILSIVAHDLRSPFSNIQSLIQLMLSFELTEEDKARYFANIRESCQRADAIIIDLVYAAKEENIGVMKTASLKMNTFLQNVCTEWERGLNKEKTLSLILPETQVEIDVNKDKMQRVLDNLISNAVKFTPKGTGKIDLELKSRADAITIVVKDNGIGIPKQQLPYLFDRFTPAGRKGLKNEPSMGLGLSICKQIVEQHSGEILVETEENVGTTFYIHIPRKAS